VFKVLFIHQLMHKWVVLKNSIKIHIKIYIKMAPTCFGVTVTPSSDSALIGAYYGYCNTKTCRSCFNLTLILFFKTTHWCVSWWVNKTLIISRWRTARMWKSKVCSSIVTHSELEKYASVTKWNYTSLITLCGP